MAAVEYTIDELARAADTTVRSVRVYHERGLLPSPDVRGRIGYYDADHLNRLQTISRLLSRGMKLNGIRELLDAWDRGDGLAEVLGVADQPAAPAPASASAAPETSDAPPELELPDYVKEALAGSDDPLDAYRVMNPRCHDLASRLVDSGLPVESAIQLVERLRQECDRLTGSFATEVYYLLAGQQYERSERSPKDYAKLETELAIARLIATRAASELIDQSFGRHAETPPHTATRKPA
ncbi:MerR family transcriptional regulator [Nocardia sp. N2S4-5]|uniref:MerR family transcriptional regulator n=1 Tax=Nocardia sp. N2S4-5 TaxID=3351565 RepID=UPI0037D326A5